MGADATVNVSLAYFLSGDIWHHYIDKSKPRSGKRMDQLLLRDHYSIPNMNDHILYLPYIAF